MSTPSLPAYHNPILPGFHPDPSICRVGEWYYLAVSSFTYFPGVPLYKSLDLVNWQAVGPALNRPSQFPPSPQRHSQGIFAPTLRHDGHRFYLITTNVGGCGTFVVTADAIEGPWSDPVVLEDAPGIDPSLYFENGRAWVTGTADAPDGPKYYGNNEIWLREWDPQTGAWKGPRIGLWRGAVRDAVWPEGPHLYKRGDWYYLMISEGGTADDHAVTIARSRSIEGPYEGYRKNPFLTHRHLGRAYPVMGVGHADLVETPEGAWWMVLLGSRPHSGGGTNRGRETFLAPVTWEDDWPVVAAGQGVVPSSGPWPTAGVHPWPGQDPSGAFDGFEAPRLDHGWTFLRCPATEVHSLSARPGWLRLLGQDEGPGTKATQAWVGRRVQHASWVAQTRLDGAALGAARAGLCVFQSDDYHLRLDVAAGRLVLVARIKGEETTLAQAAGVPTHLELTCRGHRYTARWSAGDEWHTLGEADGGFLTTEVAGGFVGCMVGPFAVQGPADFDWFDYRGHPVP